MTDPQLDLEFAYITWAQSCKDPSPTLQECRRRHGHDGPHAAGFGAGRTLWPRLPRGDVWHDPRDWS